jgi:mono/diheme cytochrome c family protein
MNKVLYVLALSLLFSCGGDKPANENSDDQSYETAEPKSNVPETVAAGKGVGEVKSVDLTTPLDQDRVARGKAIYDMKCQACHRLDDQRVVGPGWKAVTSRRKPEWIMNMITNVDMMLEQDPEAQKLLEQCLTRMPNQNVSIGDARDILEFMRQNDGEK